LHGIGITELASVPPPLPKKNYTKRDSYQTSYRSGEIGDG
jgi:hypothetical protein